MTRHAALALAAFMLPAFSACAQIERDDHSMHYGLGRPASAPEIAARDVDVGPDGAGLPTGSGAATDGQALYAQKCAVCHGAKGEGIAPLYPRLVGRDPAAEKFVFGSTPGLTRTIGNYWPFATTLFDYLRRAMPLTAPGSLTNDEVYALTAYLLAANEVIPTNARLDAASLRSVKMPYVDRFVPDNRRGGREVK